MSSALLTLVDAGPLVAYFDQADDWHEDSSEFIDAFQGQLVTTAPVITEVMWHLRRDYKVQNELLARIASGVVRHETLLTSDFLRIAELNAQFANLPADIADLSLLAVAERCGILHILSLDREFDDYRIRRGHKNVALRRIMP